MKSIKRIAATVCAMALCLAMAGCTENKATEFTIGINQREMTVGENQTLTVDLTEEAEILWESSDETVITVDENGTVNAVSVGTAEISATIGEIKNSVAINVAEPAPKPTPESTAEPTPEVTTEPTAVSKPTEKPVATPNPTPKPTAKPTATPEPVKTPEPTPVPAPVETPQPTVKPAETPAPAQKCDYCGSTSHTTHPTCAHCGSKDHVEHPKCSYCGSLDHANHPTCAECGSKDHTTHPNEAPQYDDTRFTGETSYIEGERDFGFD